MISNGFDQLYWLNFRCEFVYVKCEICVQECCQEAKECIGAGGYDYDCLSCSGKKGESPPS